MLLKKKNECLNNIDFWFFYSLKIDQLYRFTYSYYYNIGNYYYKIYNIKYNLYINKNKNF